jgi:uncharacterized protein (TIGR02996 family)
MTDWPSLLKAIRRAPADDTLRLAAADFLEEEGKAKWAELIRVQIDRARGLIPGGPSHEGHVDGLMDNVDWGLPLGWLGVRKEYRDMGPKVFVVERGFIKKVFLTGKEWADLAPHFVNAAVREVHLSSWPDFEPADWRDRWGRRVPFTLVEPTTGASSRINSDPLRAAHLLLKAAWSEVTKWTVQGAESHNE